jgi:hypothetical protein
MRGDLILLYNYILTIFQAYPCERKKLLFKYDLTITISVNVSFLTLLYAFFILLIPFPFRPLISRLTSKIDYFNAIYKLSFLFISRLVLAIPFIDKFLSLFFLLLNFFNLNVARPFFIPRKIGPKHELAKILLPPIYYM